MRTIKYQRMSMEDFQAIVNMAIAAKLETVSSPGPVDLGDGTVDLGNGVVGLKDELRVVSVEVCDPVEE